MTGRQAHRMGTIVLSLAMAVIGVALVAQALAGHGGVFSGRTILGVLFVAAGSGRLYIQAKKDGPHAKGESATVKGDSSTGEGTAGRRGA